MLTTARTNKDPVTAAARGWGLLLPNKSKFICLLAGVLFGAGMFAALNQLAAIADAARPASASMNVSAKASVARVGDPGEPPSHQQIESGFFKGFDPAHIHQPGFVEQRVLDHPRELGCDNQNGASVCPIWKNATASKEICKSLHTCSNNLQQCNKLVDTFKPIDDLRMAMNSNDSESNHKEVRQAVQLHTDGLRGGVQVQWSIVLHANFWTHRTSFAAVETS
jgi:hypothetical protein